MRSTKNWNLYCIFVKDSFSLIFPFPDSANTSPTRFRKKCPGAKGSISTLRPVTPTNFQTRGSRAARKVIGWGLELATFTPSPASIPRHKALRQMALFPETPANASTAATLWSWCYSLLQFYSYRFRQNTTAPSMSFKVQVRASIVMS